MKAQYTRQIRARLQRAGFDLMVSLDVGPYNRFAEEHATLCPVEDFGRKHCLGLLVGHTRAFWPPFTQAFRREPERWGHDPVDAYTEHIVSSAFQDAPRSLEIYYSHDLGSPRQVSMLHLVQLSGFAQMGPAYLAVHPHLGPWFALRALVSIDAAAPAEPASKVDLCTPCAKPCEAALSSVMAKRSEPSSGATHDWRAWLAVRDACPYGRESRYSEMQLSYHYDPKLKKLR